jgi:hypothetical protein
VIATSHQRTDWKQADDRLADHPYPILHQRYSGEQICAGHDLGVDRPPRIGVAIQRLGRRPFESGVERPTERHRIVNARVHTLTTQRAVHVRGVASDGHASHSKSVGHPMMDADTRAPNDVADDRSARGHMPPGGAL